jgi:four helix bundle protein
MTKPEWRMTNEAPMMNEEEDFWSPWPESVSDCVREDAASYGDKKRVFDLEERTARFGEAVIRCLKTVPQGPLTNRLIDQLVGAGTSVGANYCEADDAVSKKDFKNRIGTCRKESRESKHFLRMIAAAVPDKRLDARDLWREAHELNLIFSTIFKNTQTDAK